MTHNSNNNCRKCRSKIGLADSVQRYSMANYSGVQDIQRIDTMITTASRLWSRCQFTMRKTLKAPPARGKNSTRQTHGSPIIVNYAASQLGDPNADNIVAIIMSPFASKQLYIQNKKVFFPLTSPLISVNKYQIMISMIKPLEYRGN